MQCIVVKSDEFENSSPLIYFPQILIMLLLAPYGRSAAINGLSLFFLRVKLLLYILEALRHDNISMKKEIYGKLKLRKSA